MYRYTHVVANPKRAPKFNAKYLSNVSVPKLGKVDYETARPPFHTGDSEIPCHFFIKSLVQSCVTVETAARAYFHNGGVLGF